MHMNKQREYIGADSNFSIFNTENQAIVECLGLPNVIDGCDALKRLAFALKYYSRFDVIQDQSDQDIFSNFMINIYTDFLNDYIHLIDHHPQQSQEVNELLKKDEQFQCLANFLLGTSVWLLATLRVLLVTKHSVMKVRHI